MSFARSGSVMVMVLVLVARAIAQGPERISPVAHADVELQEPSDMVLVPGSDPARFYMVSDNGHVAEVRSDGTRKRIAEDIAFDLEGVILHEGELLVVDERTRRIIWLDTIDLHVTRRLTIPYEGGRNKGYEALVWHPVKERFLLITERDPVRIYELDRDFRVVNEVDLDLGVRDISSATWHNGQLWLLSDMDMLVQQCDPKDYSLIASWTVPVINPEGFAFDGRGNLFVLSDDRQRLYTFPFPTDGAH
jgi:uncharacterized protein YjiK